MGSGGGGSASSAAAGLSVQGGRVGKARSTVDSDWATVTSAGVVRRFTGPAGRHEAGRFTGPAGRRRRRLGPRRARRGAADSARWPDGGWVA